jgi:hypothetical protein
MTEFGSELPNVKCSAYNTQSCTVLGVKLGAVATTSTVH